MRGQHPSNVDRVLHNAHLLQHNGRLRQAEAAYHQLLRQYPNHPGGLCGLGTLALQAGRPEAALPLLQRSVQVAPRDAVCRLNLGLAHQALGQIEAAIESLTTAVQLRPNLAESQLRLGLILAQTQRYPEAVRALRRAIASQRDDIRGYVGLSQALIAQGRVDKAADALQKALQIEPNNPACHVDLGNLRIVQNRHGDAMTCYRHALEFRPDHRPALDNLVDTQLKVCEWAGIPRLRERYLEPAVANAANTEAPARPMLVTRLPIAVTEAEQQAVARAMVRVRSTLLNKRLRGRVDFTYGHDHDNGKLRIGYLSTDFCNHATSHLIQDLFALHDRSRFTIFAYAIGPDDGSAYRRRIQADCDYFRDAHTADAIELARIINGDHIDVLIDLNSHSGRNRIETLALRPAPIQVGYLGYPGTSGAPFIDYILTDHVVTPAETQPWYDEKFVFLPHCYQINSRRPAPPDSPSRAACGLPEQGFVFCCFNTHYKLEPSFFALWMRLLNKIPGSILWLLDGPEEMMANLRKEAAHHGIAANRLIFARHQPVEKHISRLGQADLFLDTRFYNAHTTASDALWAGVPVLTLAGDRFAGRVGKSLVTAAGLPELAVASPEEYESTALRLALNPDQLANIKARLTTNRETCALFDTPAFVHHLEQAYLRMWSAYRAGTAPTQIAIPASAEP